MLSVEIVFQALAVDMVWHKKANDTGFGITLESRLYIFLITLFLSKAT